VFDGVGRTLSWFTAFQKITSEAGILIGENLTALKLTETAQHG
jgi:hypothetical protein